MTCIPVVSNSLLASVPGLQQILLMLRTWRDDYICHDRSRIILTWLGQTTERMINTIACILWWKRLVRHIFRVVMSCFSNCPKRRQQYQADDRNAMASISLSLVSVFLIAYLLYMLYMQHMHTAYTEYEKWASTSNAAFACSAGIIMTLNGIAFCKALTTSHICQ